MAHFTGKSSFTFLKTHSLWDTSINLTDREILFFQIRTKDTLYVYYGNIISPYAFINSQNVQLGNIVAVFSCYRNKLLNLLADQRRQTENLIGFYQYIKKRL